MHRSLRLMSVFANGTSRPAAAPNRLVALAATIATIATVGLAGMTVVAPAPAFAAETSAGEIGMKAFDVIVLRTGGLFRLVIGSAFMLPTSALNLAALPFQGTAVYAESAEILVLEPFRYTFQRPLGQDLEGE